MDLHEEMVSFIQATPEVQREIYYEMYPRFGILEMNKEFARCIKTKGKDDKKQYYYLLTFTLKGGITQYDDIQSYIIKRLRAPALLIKKCHIVKEYTIGAIHLCKRIKVGRIF